MGGKGLTITAAILAVLAGLLWWSNREKAKEATKPPADLSPKILSLTDADVQKLDIKKRGADETILQKTNNRWEMTAPEKYPLDQDVVGTLVSSVASVGSDRLVDDKATDVKQYGLDAPSLEVDVTTRNGKTNKLLIGDDAPGGSAAYAKLASDPKVYTVASFTKTNLDKSPKDLRDKRLLTFDQDKISRVELVTKKQDIEFGRSKDEWQILKPKPMRADGLQVEELVRKLKDAKMDLTIADDDLKKAAASFASATPVATVKVTDSKGTQELQIRKKGDDYYAQSSAAAGAYKMPADLGAAVDKSVDAFRNKKLFDFGFSEPTKVEMHAAGKAYSFQKAGEKWMSNGKEMDNTSVQALLDKLRDFSASNFVDTGFSSPAIDVTVVSGDGKKTEKVLIAKSASGYIGQREGEPSLYGLDTKTVDDLTRAAADVKPAAPPKKK